MFGRSKKKENTQTNLNVFEIQVLGQIEERINIFRNKIETLKALNIQQLKIVNEKNMYLSQIEEMKNILDSIIYLLDILDFLKNYIRMFINEAKSNEYLDPNTKMYALYVLQDKIEKIKNRVDNLFLELEMLRNNLNIF